jgi:ureidoacrylate peracid hydrolase
MPEFPLIPGRAALINVDTQKCFVEGSPLAVPGGPELVARINRLSDACRAAGALVVHTRGRLRTDESTHGVAREIVPPFIRELYTQGSPSAELHESLVVDEQDIVVDKPRYGAFTGTDLELILRSRGIDTVMVTGSNTNICCETTAREAAQLDFRVFFVNDGTATSDMNGVSADDLQRATCASLSMVFAQIATVDELIAKLGGSNRGSARESAVAHA